MDIQKEMLKSTKGVNQIKEEIINTCDMTGLRPGKVLTVLYELLAEQNGMEVEVTVSKKEEEQAL